MLDLSVPNLGRSAHVLGLGCARDLSIARGAQEIAFQFDGRETFGAVRHVHPGRDTAGRIRQRDH